MSTILTTIFVLGDTYFDSDVYVNDLFFEKLINDINFNEYVKSTVFKNISSVISGRKLFTGDVSILLIHKSNICLVCVMK